MGDEYYGRGWNVVDLAGQRMFATEEDRCAEDEVAATIEKAWSCQLKRFGMLSPIDWYALRSHHLVGVLELKRRYHGSGRHPTVWLNLRKWLALQLGATGFHVGAIFVVRFDDVTKWIDLADVDASRIALGGCREIVKSRSDIEPVIEVPVEKMSEVR